MGVKDIVGRGHQALMPDHQPGAPEDLLHLVVVDRLLAEDAAVELAVDGIDDGVFPSGAHTRLLPLARIIAGSGRIITGEQTGARGSHRAGRKASVYDGLLWLSVDAAGAGRRGTGEAWRIPTIFMKSGWSSPPMTSGSRSCSRCSPKASLRASRNGRARTASGARCALPSGRETWHCRRSK